MVITTIFAIAALASNVSSRTSKASKEPKALHRGLARLQKFFTRRAFVGLSYLFPFVLLGHVYEIRSGRIALAYFLFVIVLIVALFPAIQEGTIYRRKKLLVPKDYVLLSSTWICAFVVYILQSLARYVAWVIAAFVAVSYTIIAISSARLLKHYSPWRLRLVRFYSLVIVLLLGVNAYSIYDATKDLLIRDNGQKRTFITQEIKKGYEDFKGEVQEKREEWFVTETGGNQTGTDVLPSTGLNLSTGEVATTGTILNTGDIFTGEIVIGDTVISEDFTGDIIIGGEGTGSLLTGEIIEEEAPVAPLQDPEQLQTYRDILHVLFADESLLLSQSTTRFARVAKTDPDYAYFATAAKWSMIGKNINPDGYVKCETLMVMK